MKRLRILSTNSVECRDQSISKGQILLLTVSGVTGRGIVRLEDTAV